MNKKPIIILGGMGPEASAYLYNLLIKQSIDLFDAKNNDDFPEIVLDSIPVPDFISSDKKRAISLRILEDRVERLNALEPICMAIACNTAHVLLHDLEKKAKAPFISIIMEMIETVKKDNYKKIGLLGTPSTIKSNMYQDAFQKIGIETLSPTDQHIDKLEEIIRNVIAGDLNSNDTSDLKKIANSLVAKGAECIVLGCTELPLVFPKNYKVKSFSSLEVLSKKLLDKYYSQTV